MKKSAAIPVSTSPDPKKILYARRVKFTDYFRDKHLERHNQKPFFGSFDWMWNTASDITAQFSDEEIRLRVDNFFKDPYLNVHPFQKLIKEWDAFIQIRGRPFEVARSKELSEEEKRHKISLEHTAKVLAGLKS